MNLKEACDHLLFSTKVTNHEHRVVLTEFVDPLLFLKDRDRILSYILMSETNPNQKKRIKRDKIEKEKIEKEKIEKENLPYFYFRNRQTMKTYAGFGIGDMIAFSNGVEFLSELQQKCHKLSIEYGCKVNYFASLSFKNLNSYSWGCFPPRFFVLPQILLIYDEQTQTQDILFFDQKYGSNKKEAISFSFVPPCLNDVPQKRGFLQKFASVQSFLREEGKTTRNSRKIVLALQKYASSKKLPLDVLQKISSSEKENFHFLYNIDGQTSFLGCTPEMLCHIQKNPNETTHTIYSEALAGTVVRGSTITEDLKLEKKLLNSKKDEEEHQIVIDGIVSVLQKYCSSVLYEQKPSIRKQNFVQHLCTKITAEYKETNSNIPHKTSLQDLIFALHPTPAVCGYPKEESREMISKIEDFDRGLYAGAIGMISFDEITFCVGIRSALHHKDHYWFWGGAGLVKSSKPNAEFDEMNNKMKAFQQLVVEDNDFEKSNRDKVQNLQLKEPDMKVKSLSKSGIKTNDVENNNLLKENSLRKKVN